jgi:tetratricopeptide (TPR) repeat protein
MIRAVRHWLGRGLLRLLGATALAVAGASAGCGKLSWTPKEQQPKLEEPRAAAKDRDPISSNRPATPKTKYAYARVLAAEGKEAACDALLTMVIAENPRFTAAHLLLAEVRMRSRRIDDAISALVMGLEVSPRDDVLWNNLGICFMMKSDCENALIDFTTAAALQPGNARYRSNMALALGLMGRQEESLSLYTMVLPATDAEHNLSILASARGAFFGPGDAWPSTISDGAGRRQAEVPASEHPGLRPLTASESQDCRE